MKVVIQRVKHAEVVVNGKREGSISEGLMILAGFVPADTTEDFQWMAKKILGLRIFNDEHGVMNHAVLEKNGEILLVSQFTLHASTKKGNRPSYIRAAKPDVAKKMYLQFQEVLEQEFGKKIQTGVFGADMKVTLLNDGPVTIIIDTEHKE
jgi:D-tyrosyl-tRNA(Tyr) deacylase